MSPQLPLGCDSFPDFLVFDELGGFEEAWSAILENSPQLRFVCVPLTSGPLTPAYRGHVISCMVVKSHHGLPLLT